MKLVERKPTMTESKRKWWDDRIVRGDQLDLNTPQTTGMTRAAVT
jgi:hypothetical protein